LGYSDLKTRCHPEFISGSILKQVQDDKIKNCYIMCSVYDNTVCIYFRSGMGVVSECGDFSDDSGDLSPLGTIGLPEVQKDNFLET
jgi:hypothetical protein